MHAARHALVYTRIRAGLEFAFDLEDNCIALYMYSYCMNTCIYASAPVRRYVYEEDEGRRIGLDYLDSSGVMSWYTGSKKHVGVAEISAYLEDVCLQEEEDQRRKRRYVPT